MPSPEWVTLATLLFDTLVSVPKVFRGSWCSDPRQLLRSRGSRSPAKLMRQTTSYFIEKTNKVEFNKQKGILLSQNA